MACSKRSRKSTRSSKGCWTCRYRKIRCDLKRNSCDNCLNAKLKCEGYYSKLNWYELQTVSKNPAINKPKVVKTPTSNSRSFIQFVNWGNQEYFFEEVLDNDIHFSLGPFTSWQLNIQNTNEQLLSLNSELANKGIKKNDETSNHDADAKYPSSVDMNNYISRNKVRSWIDSSLFDNYLISKIFEECNFKYIRFLNNHDVISADNDNENIDDEIPSLQQSLSYFIENFNDCNDLIFDVFQNEIIFKISRLRDTQDLESMWFKIFQDWIIKQINLESLLEKLKDLNSSNKKNKCEDITISMLLVLQIIKISNYYKFLKFKQKSCLVFAIHIQNILVQLNSPHLSRMLVSSPSNYILDVFLYELLKIHFDAILTLNIEFINCFESYALLLSAFQHNNNGKPNFFPNDRSLFSDICEYFEALIILYDTTSTSSDSKKFNFVTQLKNRKLESKFIKKSFGKTYDRENISKMEDPSQSDNAMIHKEIKLTTSKLMHEGAHVSHSLNEKTEAGVVSKVHHKDTHKVEGSGDIHYDYEYNDDIDDPTPPELEIQFNFGSTLDSPKNVKSFDDNLDNQMISKKENFPLIEINKINSNLEQNFCNFPKRLIFDFQYRIVSLLQRFKNYSNHNLEVHGEANITDSCNIRNNIVYQYHDSMDLISSLEYDLESWHSPWNLYDRSANERESGNDATRIDETENDLDEKTFHSRKCKSYYLKTKIFHDFLLLFFFTRIKDIPEDCLRPYIREILKFISYHEDETEKNNGNKDDFFILSSSMMLSLPIFLASCEIGNFDYSNGNNIDGDAKREQLSLQMNTKSQIFDRIIQDYWNGDVLYCNWRAIQVVYEVWRIRSESDNIHTPDEEMDVSWELVIRELGFSLLLL